jgi:hypothetical protein
MCSLTRAFASGLTASSFCVKSAFVRFVNAKDEMGVVADDEAVAFFVAVRSSDRCVLPSMVKDDGGVVQGRPRRRTRSDSDI